MIKKLFNVFCLKTIVLKEEYNFNLYISEQQQLIKPL